MLAFGNLIHIETACKNTVNTTDGDFYKFLWVYIYRNHVYDKGEGGPKSIELKEIGPRFELRLYQVRILLNRIKTVFLE